MKLCERWSVVSNSMRPYGLYSQWNSPGQKTRVGSLSILQGIFPTQVGIKSRSPALQADSLPAKPQGKSCVNVKIIVKEETYNGKTWFFESNEY